MSGGPRNASSIFSSLGRTRNGTTPIRSQKPTASTILGDVVRYRLHLAFLQRSALMAWVHRDVRRIFEYRQSVIAGMFGA